MRTIVTDQKQTVARHQVHEPSEREQHGIEIGVNIGVIELDVVDDGDVWQILQKFRTLVEKGAVVLVAFDDEVTPAANAVA